MFRVWWYGWIFKAHSEYQKLLQSSGLRPIDKLGEQKPWDERSFSQIFEEIEKDGFIKPAPIKENQDIVDKTIQYIMNYTLKLLNQQILTEPPIDTPKIDGDGKWVIYIIKDQRKNTNHTDDTPRFNASDYRG